MSTYINFKIGKIMFKKTENGNAFLKAGLLGFAGSGKSTTAINIAGGLICHLKKENKYNNKPVFFLDTENGIDFVKNILQSQNIDVMDCRSRAFIDLLKAIDVAEKEASVLIIDSITHFWVDLTDSYMRAKKRNRLLFQDWAVLKQQWRQFTDKFINSNVHIILCGRAGYEYDHFEDDAGKKELEKTGIKMKAEGETGYEANLLILMERKQTLVREVLHQFRQATILKDRTRTIDGKTFVNPRFNDFKPHIDFLNIGGTQNVIDMSRNSNDMFTKDENEFDWQKKQREKTICLEEIEAELKKIPSDKTGKEKKAQIMQLIFGTESWTAIENMKFEKLDIARDNVWNELRGYGYYEEKKEKKEETV
jgi:hypothetical protein